MNDAKTKPREFAIADPDRYGHSDMGSLVCYEDPKELSAYEGNTLHVIEYSAFEETRTSLQDAQKDFANAQAEIERLKNKTPKLSRNEKAICKDMGDMAFGIVMKERNEWQQMAEILAGELSYHKTTIVNGFAVDNDDVAKALDKFEEFKKLHGKVL